MSTRKWKKAVMSGEGQQRRSERMRNKLKRRSHCYMPLLPSRSRVWKMKGKKISKARRRKGGRLLQGFVVSLSRPSAIYWAARWYQEQKRRRWNDYLKEGGDRKGKADVQAARAETHSIAYILDNSLQTNYSTSLVLLIIFPRSTKTTSGAIVRFLQQFTYRFTQ